MERITELSERTLTALFASYALWGALMVLILVFVIYLYIFPNAGFEGFSSAGRRENTRKHQ